MTVNPAERKTKLSKHLLQMKVSVCICLVYLNHFAVASRSAMGKKRECGMRGSQRGHDTRYRSSEIPTLSDADRRTNVSFMKILVILYFSLRNS